MAKPHEFKNTSFTWAWVAVMLGVAAISIYFAWHGSSLSILVADVGVLILTVFLAFIISLRRARKSFSSNSFVRLLFGMLCVGAFAAVAFMVSPMLRLAVMDNLYYLSTMVLFLFAGLLVYFQYLELGKKD